MTFNDLYIYIILFKGFLFKLRKYLQSINIQSLIIIFLLLNDKTLSNSWLTQNQCSDDKFYHSKLHYLSENIYQLRCFSIFSVLFSSPFSSMTAFMCILSTSTNEFLQLSNTIPWYFFSESLTIFLPETSRLFLVSLSS